MRPSEKLGKWFTYAECTKTEIRGVDNTPDEISLAAMRRTIEHVLDPLRDALGPVFVSSFYRSPKVNVMVRSGKRSQHLKGEAADIVVPGKSNWETAVWIAEHLPFDQLILEYLSDDGFAGWIHVSFRAGRNRHEIRTKQRDVHGYPQITVEQLMEMADAALAR